jgi:hypothetical protein
MARISGKLDLGQVSDEQYKPDLDLRMAVVREGSILGSTTLKAGEASQKRLLFVIEFEPPILPGAHLQLRRSRRRIADHDDRIGQRELFRAGQEEQQRR